MFNKKYYNQQEAPKLGNQFTDDESKHYNLKIVLQKYLPYFIPKNILETITPDLVK